MMKKVAEHTQGSPSGEQEETFMHNLVGQPAILSLCTEAKSSVKAQ
jgi:hypothetical protein